MGVITEGLKIGKKFLKNRKDKKSKAYLKKREKEHIETETLPSGLKKYRTPEESKKIADNIAKNRKEMGYKTGGPVKKCKVDGIAKRGFTRAKHK